MGRHSAPDETPDDGGGSAVAIASIAGVVPEVPIRRGRHARDDDGELPAVTATDDTARIAAVRIDPDGPVPAAPAPSWTEEPPEFVWAVLHDDTSEIEPVAASDAPPPAPSAGRATPVPEVAAPGGRDARSRQSPGGSKADFRLIRAHGDVRARCIAGAVVPFALYLAVFAVIGKFGVQMLMWIWIPLITAGVLVGAFLDAGHRRYGPGQSGEGAVQQG